MGNEDYGGYSGSAGDAAVREMLSEDRRRFLGIAKRMSRAIELNRIQPVGFETRSTAAGESQQDVRPAEISRDNADSEYPDQIYNLEKSQSKALEYIFGIGAKREWFGVEADYRPTALADSTMNRIGAVLTTSEREGLALPFIGIDFTVTGSQEDIRERLQVSSYDQEVDLPEGCSQIFHYEHNDKESILPIVPRYVIAMSGEVVESIVRTNVQLARVSEDSPREEISVVEPKSISMLLFRHKILSELYAQAELRCNQLNFEMTKELTDDRELALDAFMVQKDIFEGALAEVEWEITEKKQSLKDLQNPKRVNKELINAAKEDDPAYAALMDETSKMNDEVAKRRFGQEAAGAAAMEAGEQK